jgi:hypothetical protein
VASLLLAAAKAELSGALAQQLQTALDSRGLIERAKGALMEREHSDEQEAFTHLRRAAVCARTQGTEPENFDVDKMLEPGTSPAPDGYEGREAALQEIEAARDRARWTASD